jgi:hypothetical protein
MLVSVDESVGRQEIERERVERVSECVPPH